MVVFWDAVLGVEITRFDFHEPVLGVRLNCRWMLVVLLERVVVFEYQEVEALKYPTPPPASTDDDAAKDQAWRAPNLVKSVIATSTNPHAVAVLRGDLLALPAQSTGQVQLVSLKGGSKRVLRAHNSSLHCMALSDDATILATTSEQGTLIRVFDTKTLDQLSEFRRGMDHALIFGLAFSPRNRWLASTSDKGTLHVFDLRPPDAAEIEAAREKQAKERQHRKSQSYASHRLSGTGYEKESVSGISGRSSPASGTGYQGSVQEYYGLRPPPSSASPPGQQAAVSAMAALKASPFTPRILKDVRSVASAPFYVGNDPPHWQGGPAYSWTMTPNGTKKRVRNPIVPLPGDASGRPPKGILSFSPAKAGAASEDDSATLYVIGGGSDARWEKFELLPTDTGGRVLLNRGFRKYLTRQFVD